MKWLADLFSGSVGRKLVMALTGFFLVLFLIVHLIGNLQLLQADGGRSFNLYAHFMGSNIFIQTISKVNFLLILAHIGWGIFLTVKNRAARGQERYAKVVNSSSWTSRNMALFGTLLALFLLIHLRHFYAEAHWGGIPMVTYGESSVQDLYTVVSYWFGKGWYVALYVLCMVSLGFHLWHGFASAFQTLGIKVPKYAALIEATGKIFAVVVPVLYAAIPVLIFLC